MVLRVLFDGINDGVDYVTAILNNAKPQGRETRSCTSLENVVIAVLTI